MPLQRRTRIVLGSALGAPVAFVLAYPWLCRLLPLQVEEWTDLPRDLIGFLAADAAVTVAVLLAFRLRDPKTPSS